jgi:hypothetical protein
MRTRAFPVEAHLSTVDLRVRVFEGFAYASESTAECFAGLG